MIDYVDEDDSWDESDNLSNWDEEEKLEINMYTTYKINVQNHELSKLIELNIETFADYFKKFGNIFFRHFRILILYDLKMNITDIRIKCINNVEELNINNKVLISKLEKIINAKKINLNEPFIDDIIDSFYLYFKYTIQHTCFMCDKIATYRNSKYLNANLCGNMLCLANSFVSDLFLLQTEVENNPERFRFMLYLFLYSCAINRVPNILPDNTNLEEILELFKDIEDINDLDKLLLIGNNNLIILLNWLIFTYNDIITLSDKSTKNNIIFNINENDVTKTEYFSVVNQEHKEKILNRYHGSIDHNYFNIILGGLKNFSTSKYQVNGAAHGNGVYFGTEETAKGYNYTVANPSTTNNNSHVLELLKKYKYWTCTKILNCDIYYEDNTWTNTDFCTVIPKNENIMIKTMNIYI